MTDLITTSSHGKGYTCLAFAPNGQRAFTGGQDCIVRIWNVHEGQEQEPVTAAEADGAVTSVASTDDCWLSSSEDTEVRRYSRDTSQFDAPLTSTAGVPVRCVAIDRKGRRAAVASDELFVKVIDLEDVMNVVRLEGYTAGVRSVSWHPNNNLLATCTCDGKVIVWNTSSQEKEPSIEKTMEGLIPAVIDTEALEFSYDCSVVWHPSGEYFFVATKSHELITVSRSDWTKSSTFSDKEVSGSITALAVSPNGVYVASASQSTVYVWSAQTRRIVASQKGTAGAVITKLAFSPTENLIAWTDTNGGFTRWQKPIGDKHPDPVKVTFASSAPATVPTKTKPLKNGLDLFLNDAEDLAEAGDAVDEDLDVDLDDVGEMDLGDDWIVDDTNGALNDKPKDGFVKEMVSITKAQPPFQPGSTPMANQKRFLAFNMLGSIDVSEVDGHNVVNIDFFDKSTRKSKNFRDNYRYDMGYLGERGAVFACPPEQDHTAEVHFRAYNSGSTGDWVYKMRQGTRVLGVAAAGMPMTPQNAADAELDGYGHVVVATSEGDLTFLSGTGRERRIIALSGDFVTMVASSQNLSYSLFNIDDFTVRQRDVLPVPKGHTLKWLGVTDDGAPVMYDSTGCVHILYKHRVPHHASWTRVMDTNLLERRQNKDESYWPVGITGSTFNCLILKGKQTYPGFPRPIPQELPMQMPFRGTVSSEEMIERELFRNQIVYDSLEEELTTEAVVSRELAVDKELMTLIQQACRAGSSARAIELVKLLHNLASIDNAIKIADFYRLVGLREKFDIIKQDRQDREDRLIVARNKRRRWMKPDPPLRELAPPTRGPARFDPLGDTRPPPVIERPGMTRVTKPVIETTRFSSTSYVPASSQSMSTDQVSWESDSLNNNSSSFLTDSPPPIEKRKRMDLDDSFPSSDFSMPPPKQKANPFARKITSETNKNPFARRPDISSKTIQKSESFFDKVDAAESETAPKKKGGVAASKAPSKDTKKEGPKQATLFGMMPKADKAAKVKKNAKETVPIPIAVEETQPVDDISMSDAGAFETQVEETQETQEEETPRAGSPDWDETQMMQDVEVPSEAVL
ncbi:hypothetical protein D9619_011727 [Psilocybe cf. subviscida]|uniref:Minichromosome loss protein Mcl1 middle region domain-containing protein n=1 Tax=Psilocybe cf. subviscida TaxID=2480587 RepID=A0A8H5BV09_9AGAR|nr:hypothetical protein D9619_011727 [Psilocybe cf. subviscida]